MKFVFGLNVLVVAAMAFIFSSCKNEDEPKISFSVAVSASNAETQGKELTTAQITVTGEGDLLGDKNLDSAINTVRVKDEIAAYTITISKSGYKTYEHDFTATQLKAFAEGSPLNVELEPVLSFSVKVLAYNTATKNYETTAATIVVTSTSDLLYDDELPATTNTVDVQDGMLLYTVTVTKEGYDTYQTQFFETELEAFVPGSPLEVNLLLASTDDGRVARSKVGGNAVGRI